MRPEGRAARISATSAETPARGGLRITRSAGRWSGRCSSTDPSTNTAPAGAPRRASALRRGRSRCRPRARPRARAAARAGRRRSRRPPPAARDVAGEAEHVRLQQRRRRAVHLEEGGAGELERLVAPRLRQPRRTGEQLRRLPGAVPDRGEPLHRRQQLVRPSRREAALDEQRNLAAALARRVSRSVSPEGRRRASGPQAARKASHTRAIGSSGRRQRRRGPPPALRLAQGVEARHHRPAAPRRSAKETRLR
jgi:hypothetical protein